MLSLFSQEQCGDLTVVNKIIGGAERYMSWQRCTKMKGRGLRQRAGLFRGALRNNLDVHELAWPDGYEH